MVKRIVRKTEPPMIAEGKPGANQIASLDDRARTEIRRARSTKRKRKPSAPGPLTTDISSLFKDRK